MALSNIEFIIVALNQDVVDAFKNEFDELPNFTIKRSNILQIKSADCIVSPGNSYGLMDGGVDGDINYALDFIDSKVIRPYIQQVYHGEQPVGTCDIFQTNQTSFKYLAHTPTMRVPQSVVQTNNAYIAMRALLIEILKHNTIRKDIQTVLMTGFCCGHGQYDAKRSAKEMRLAYKMIEKNEICTWGNAHKLSTQLKLCEN
jgi:O-acetyl-ADP-ribose deacetylase (regulator of RNase III)